jgi:hypothetical protein
MSRTTVSGTQTANGSELFERGFVAEIPWDIDVDKARGASWEAEYHTIQQAKRRTVALIQFISDLYRLQMLTERIIHECIKKLLWNVDYPKEEEVEGVCRLFMTAGKLVNDHPKAHAHLDIYFTRVERLRKNSYLEPRIQFMLQVSPMAHVSTVLPILFYPGCH